MKKNLIFRAPVLTQSGYGVHARQVYKWLDKNRHKYNIFIEALNWGNTSWFIDSKSLDGLIGKIMRDTRPLPNGQKFDISIQLVLPNEWKPGLADFNVGMTAGVETDKCNPHWVNMVNQMDLVIVPSEHSRKTFLSSGNCFKNIHVVPESYMEEIDRENNVDLELGLETEFNFLLVGQITGNHFTDRKNIFNTIKWFCEEFRNDKDVGLVLKLNSCRNTTYDRQITKDKIKAILKECRSKKENPKIYYLHGNMTNEEMSSLYSHNKIKALLNITRGEGFYLPGIEAAASGMPVIATDWSAHVEYLSKGRFIKVNYDLVDIPKEKVVRNICPTCKGKSKGMQVCLTCGNSGYTQIFMEGSKWAEPRENSYKKALKDFRNMPEKPLAWSKELQKIVRKEYCQESIENQYSEIFNKYNL